MRFRKDGQNILMRYSIKSSVVDTDILNNIEPVIEELDNPVTVAELDSALKNTKLGKIPGPDLILPEVLFHGGTTL